MWRRDAGLRLNRLCFKLMNIPTTDRLNKLFGPSGDVVETLEFEDVNDVTDDFEGFLWTL